MKKGASPPPPAPLPQALQEWRGAEATLGCDRALERAAERLDRRLATLLRAIAALDDGRIEEVRRVASAAEAAGQPDIAAVLDTLVGDALDPTEARKLAKQRGLDRHSGLPFLDLLRLLAALRKGKRGVQSAALRAESSKRPALDAATHILTTTSDKAWFYYKLRPILPRAEQVATIYLSLDARHPVSPQWLSKHFAQGLVDLSAARWPELAGGTPEETLRRLLAGDGAWPDDDGVYASLESWLTARPERGRWLGPLLRHLARRVSAGRLVGLTGAARLAIALAAETPKLAQLQIQLIMLGLRLDWVRSGTASGPLLASLWRARPSTVSTVERLKLARLLLDAEAVDDLVVDGARLLLLATASDGDALIALMDPDDEEPLPDGWAASLGALGASVDRVAEVRALELVSWGDKVRGLDCVPALVRAGSWQVASYVACELGAEPARTGGATAARARASALSALLDAPISVAVGRGVFALVRGDTAPNPALSAWLERWSGVQDASAEHAAISLALSLRNQQPDRLATIVREEGRNLRKLGSPASDDRAAALIGLCYSMLSDLPPERLDSALEPLVRFLLREGAAQTTATLARLAAGSPAQRGMVNWYLRRAATLPQPELWRAWLRELILTPVAASMGPMYEALNLNLDRQIEAALATKPEDFDALIRGVLYGALAGGLAGAMGLHEPDLDDLEFDLPF